MPPLIAHCSPGAPSKKPGFRVIVISNRRSNVDVAVERRRARRAVRERIECRRRCHLARARGPPLGLESDRRRPFPRSRRADCSAAACRSRCRCGLPRRPERDVLELAGLVKLGAVDGEHAKRRSRDGERLLEAVRVDEPETNLRAHRDLVPSAAFVPAQRRDAIERVRRESEVDARAAPRAAR